MYHELKLNSVSAFQAGLRARVTTGGHAVIGQSVLAGRRSLTVATFTIAGI